MGFTITSSTSFDGRRYFTSTEQHAPLPIQSRCGAIASLEKWGGGKLPWYLYYVILRMKFGKAACGLWKQVSGNHDDTTIPLTGH